MRVCEGIDFDMLKPEVHEEYLMGLRCAWTLAEDFPEALVDESAMIAAWEQFKAENYDYCEMMRVSHYPQYKSVAEMPWNI